MRIVTEAVGDRLRNLDSYGVRKADAVVAYFLLRVALGLNILMHGVARIASGTGVFAATLSHTFQNTPLPRPAVLAFGTCLPWVEAALGLVLLIGLFTREALVGGSILILVLTFGSTLHQDWDVAGIQLTYALAYAALLACQGLNIYSLDVFLKARKQG